MFSLIASVFVIVAVIKDVEPGILAMFICTALICGAIEWGKAA